MSADSLLSEQTEDLKNLHIPIPKIREHADDPVI